MNAKQSPFISLSLLQQNGLHNIFPPIWPSTRFDKEIQKDRREGNWEGTEIKSLSEDTLRIDRKKNTHRKSVCLKLYI